MTRIGLALLLLTAAVPQPSRADDSRFDAILQRIDPSERLEQVCEYAALTNIGHDRAYRPDRVIMDSVSPAKVNGNSMTGSGAALRSRGKWYQFEFTCKATPDRLKIESFSYRLGAAIPERQWDKLGLWR